jgi:hypothetical protein
MDSDMRETAHVEGTPRHHQVEALNGVEEEPMDLELGDWEAHDGWVEHPKIGSGLYLLPDPWGLDGRGTGLSAEVWEDKDGWQFRVSDGESHTVPSRDTALFLAEAGLALAAWDFQQGQTRAA